MCCRSCLVPSEKQRHPEMDNLPVPEAESFLFSEAGIREDRQRKQRKMKNELALLFL